MSTTNQNQSQKPEIKDIFDKDFKCEWLVTNHNGIWELVSKTETEAKEMIDEETESSNWTEYYYVQEFEDCGEGEEPKFQPINFENLINQHFLLEGKYIELSRRFAEQAKQNEDIIKEAREWRTKYQELSEMWRHET